MTLWTGQFGTELLHDFHPGIPPSGLFWTAPVPPEAVTYDLDTGAAALRLSDYPMPDFIPEVDASGARIQTGASVPSLVAMDLTWTGGGARLTITDSANELEGSYQEGTARISWSAEESGFRFTAGPDSTTEVRFAQIGRERTGVFAVR
jgi:hypothetical protein